ncbi:replication protein A1-like protein [Trifolium medium]|uniref:Replication protein A1-like protein n=1 Tax=Trifolium medium TaxID=97028 RepID=A0A392LWD1_9FABA|nr:replication protein A1-like protein [Trifolium medium]
MSNTELESTIALQSLRAPLDPFPLTNEEKFINNMRVRFRTYYVECNVNYGAVKLLRMFAEDFGEEVCRIATLVDAKDNHLEVLVNKIDEDVYFTRGWLHVPPHFVEDLSEDLHDLSYAHDERFFDVSFEKLLTYFDVSNGYLMLPYDGFGEYAFHDATTSIKLVDDYGNVWFCSLICVTFPCKHFKVGGQWSRLVAARRLSVGSVITIGVQPDANNETLYLSSILSVLICIWSI